MSVTGSGQTRNPFTLYTSSSSLPSRSLLFFPYTTSMAWVYYTHTQKSYRNSWWKSRQRAIWLIAVILPTQNAGSIHIIDRQYPRVPPKKEEKASWQTEWGMAPPTVGVSYFHWGERKQVGHRYWAQSSWVGCCSVSSRFWFRTAEMLIHRDLFLSSISHNQSVFIMAPLVCVQQKTLSRNFPSPFS